MEWSSQLEDLKHGVAPTEQGLERLTLKDDQSTSGQQKKLKPELDLHIAESLVLALVLTEVPCSQAPSYSKSCSSVLWSSGA